MTQLYARTESPSEYSHSNISNEVQTGVKTMTKDQNHLGLRRRQVHLDFHNSEHIPCIARAFDVDTFVRSLQDAHVDSVTLFALCHHGWSYYPTKTGAPHPHLERPNLLGEMIDACKVAGIDTPVYISVQWNERLAREHPEWRVYDATNTAQHTTADDKSALNQLSPTWHTLCLNHPELVDHILEMAQEVEQQFAPPGLFFDIVVPRDCVCQACLDSMHAAGLDPQKAADRRTHGATVIDRFKRAVKAQVDAERPGTRVFFNAGHLDKTSAKAYDAYTHFELESLPTGGWGYGHFPLSARYAATLGKPFLGMTGRFHSCWGDFGGYKTEDALVYETSLSSMLGAGCSVGDQLHPSGVMNVEAYDIIGRAYARIEKLEPYLQNAKQITEIGILAAEAFAGRDGLHNNASDDGASRILLETNRCFDVLDVAADFAPYPTLIAPDGVEIDDALLEKLRAYRAQGGRLVLALDPRLKKNIAAVEALFDIKIDGEFQSTPFYIENAEGLPHDPMVVHASANIVDAGDGEWHGAISASYFNRSYRHFCSHDYSPFDPETSKTTPAAIVKANSALVTFPVFRAFRESGMPQLKRYVDGLLSRVAPLQTVKIDGPSNLFSAFNWQENEGRYVLHLLYGVPESRGWSIASGTFPNGAPIELIEDIPTLGDMNISVRMDEAPRRVYDALTQKDVAFTYVDGQVNIGLSGLKIHAALIFEVG